MRSWLPPSFKNDRLTLCKGNRHAVVFHENCCRNFTIFGKISSVSIASPEDGPAGCAVMDQRRAGANHEVS
jgi:hypothetical protein